MTGNKTLINILISVVVIVAAFFGYRYLRPASSTGALPASGLVATSASDAAKTADASDDFLRILRSLKSIEFKTEVFEYIKASQLKDFTTQLGEQTPGRVNPFAPIGSVDRGGNSVFTTGGTTTRPVATTTAPAARNTVPGR